MTSRKERLTVTVDRALLQIGSAAVEAGRADSLSGWVNLALAERVAKEQRLSAMAEAIAAYEAEFGTISDAEIRAQVRADKHAALIVRGPNKSKSKSRPARSARR